MTGAVAIDPGVLKHVLGVMLGVAVVRASHRVETLRGGTVGEVWLVSGEAAGADGGRRPYRVVLKVQKKWERPGDPDSWRREFDLYRSELGTVFGPELRWPTCYHAEMDASGAETRLWMEYVDGVSGADLTVPMLEQAAYAIGSFQGRLYAGPPDLLSGVTNLSRPGDLKQWYRHCRSWTAVYDDIRSPGCGIPRHLRQMLIDVDDHAVQVWARIERLPVVLCHRDYWVTNIIWTPGGIRLVDWDTAGWGYLGEDVKSLVTDGVDTQRMAEYYRVCVPAYLRGFGRYVGEVPVLDGWIRDLAVVNMGYALVERYRSAESAQEKERQVALLEGFSRLTG